MTEMMLDVPHVMPRTAAGVRFHKIGKVYHFDYHPFPDLRVGDRVIVQTARGRQMGEVVAFATLPDDAPAHKTILRIATPRDLVLKQYWEEREAEALELCRRRASEFSQMRGVRFIAAFYSYDGALLTLLYTSEGRVNLSKLWQDLNRQMAAQIELRQIGPRDVAKLLGGFGACGELRCCSTFLTDFSPISIKMAKVQGISLNPIEITGMCGRLRCCLVYEYEQYVQARQQLPKKNKRVGTPHGEGKVIDVMPMQDSVLVLVDETFHTIKRDELIPLEELAALAKKASEPCTKHGDGPCECGAKPGKSAAAELENQLADAELDDTQTEMLPKQDERKRSRRGRRRNKKANADAPSQQAAPREQPTPPRNEAPNRGDQTEPKSGRGRRGRSRNRRGAGDTPNDGMKAGNE